jgi:hypothetical protein
MIYLKSFDTHSEYETYMEGDKILSNVSHCEDKNDVHYNPYKRIVAKFDVVSTSSATKLSSDASLFTEIEIDGVKQNRVVSSYTFATTGEHVVKYVLADPTTISYSCFHNCPRLTSVKIPNNVTTIGEGAFQTCVNLTNVTIPNSVTTIGFAAFGGCTGLTNITIPDSVTSIGQNAFVNCSSLTNITLGKGITSIGNYAFEDCTSLPIEDDIRYADSYLVEVVDTTKTSYTIKEGTRFIGNDAFYHCSGLAAINSNVSGECIIPNGVVFIGKRAFTDAVFVNVILPDTLVYIGEDAFRLCSNLVSINIPNSVVTIDKNAFYDCWGLKSISIGYGVTTIGEFAFERCGKLTGTLIIPNNVTSIGIGAFSGCDFTSVVIGNGINRIEQSTFSDNKNLINVTIPDSVTFIGSHAFSSCSSLTTITIPNSVTFISTYAFSGCTGLTSVTIPDSVSTIGSYAFEYCRGLTSINSNVSGECIIPNSVTSIGVCILRGCTSLTSIVVENGNTVYDSRNNCNAIIETETNTLIQGCKDTVIPNTITTIDRYSFSGYSTLTGITIPSSVTTIGNAAFGACTGLTAITIPNNVTTIGQNAFDGCSNLVTITCENTTAPTIQTMTFRDVKNGGTLYVPTGSTGYDVWMGTGNYYLGKYNWTKVEQ